MNALPRDWLPTLLSFLDREPVVVRIVVAEVRGSTPREPGAFMLVGHNGVEGSIGGGQLEWEAIASARELLNDPRVTARVNKVVLGADVGQCCGGVVSVWLERFTREHLSLLHLAADAGARGCAVLTSTIRGSEVERRVIHPAGAGFVMSASSGTGAGTGLSIGASSGTGAGAGLSIGASSGTGAGTGLSIGANSGASAGMGLAIGSNGGADVGAGPTISASDDARGGLATPGGADFDADTVAGARVGVGANVDETTDRLLRAPRRRAHPVLTRNVTGDPTLHERLDDEFPAVWLYGAGHVGQALARILMELPLRLTWIDSRSELLPAASREDVRILRDSDSVATVSEAPVGAYFVVMSHSHPLDYALCHALLERNDFAWLGLIGSMSKAARFRSRLTRAGLSADIIRKLVCPIGVEGIESKWPAAIAVAVAAQLLQQISAAEADQPELLMQGHDSPHPPQVGPAPVEQSGRVGATLVKRPAQVGAAPVEQPGRVGATLVKQPARVGSAMFEQPRRAEPARAEPALAEAPCTPENCATCGSPATRPHSVIS